MFGWLNISHTSKTEQHGGAIPTEQSRVVGGSPRIGLMLINFDLIIVAFSRARELLKYVKAFRI